MLQNLMESRPSRDRHVRGMVVSVFLHAAVGTALVALGPARGDGSRVPGLSERIVPLTLPIDTRQTTGGGTAQRSEQSAERRERLPSPMPSPPVVAGVPEGIPDIPTMGLDIESGLRGLGESPESGSTAGGGTIGPVTPGRALTLDQVERAPAVIRPARPHYPGVLRDRAIEGAVTARFIIDTLGLVLPGSIRMVEEDEPLFMAEVRRALGRARFRPAEIRGKPVSVLVEQRFAFTLRQ